ncbi:hypothetical protein D3C72_1247080 [compost metagenome]
MADEQMHAGLVTVADHGVALGQAKRHGLLHQHMLSMAGGDPRVLRVELMRAGDVDDFHVAIRRQGLHAVIGRSRKILGELIPGRGARITSRHQFYPGVRKKSGKHQGECSSQPDHANTQFLLVHDAGRFDYRSRTSLPHVARDTHTMICESCSSGSNTMSRWSALPSSITVRQEPQVPLSHEYPTRTPAPSSTDRIDLPTGTSNVCPDLASSTAKGLSSGFLPPPSRKLSKWIRLGDQCPDISRTASISPLGPQQ